MAFVPLNPPVAEALVRRTAWSGPATLKYWHLASLDAPSVAVAWAWAFAWAARVRVAPALVAVLALVVWAIYLVDRLLDARAGIADPGGHSLQERHWFHWRHRRIFSMAAGIAAVTAGWMILSRLHAAALRRDSLMGLATLAYFSGVHGRGLACIRATKQRLGRVVSRELVVGVIFSAGCLAPILPSAEPGMVRMCTLLAAPAAAFAAVAWLNVMAIGRWEAGKNGVRRIALWLAAASGVFGVALGRLEPRVALLLGLLAVSSLLLGWLDEARERMDAVTLRAAADLVLLTPLLLVVPMEMAR